MFGFQENVEYFTTTGEKANKPAEIKPVRRLNHFRPIFQISQIVNTPNNALKIAGPTGLKLAKRSEGAIR